MSDEKQHHREIDALNKRFRRARRAHGRREYAWARERKQLRAELRAAEERCALLELRLKGALDGWLVDDKYTRKLAEREEATA